MNAPAAPADEAPLLARGASARLPTEFGEFTVTTFLDTPRGDEHVVLHAGEPAGEGLLLRIHSECMTGDVFGSRRCDCGPQLHLALSRIAAEGRGMLIYMRGHEGRGIGLSAKLQAYGLQDGGLDTVEANLALGHPVDARRFDAAAAILKAFGVRSVRLMSNNPLKVLALQQQGIAVANREPHAIEPNDDNRNYLATKRDRLGHWLALDVPNH